MWTCRSSGLTRSVRRVRTPNGGPPTRRPCARLCLQLTACAAWQRHLQWRLRRRTLVRAVSSGSSKRRHFPRCTGQRARNCESTRAPLLVRHTAAPMGFFVRRSPVACPAALHWTASRLHGHCSLAAVAESQVRLGPGRPCSAARLLQLSR